MHKLINYICDELEELERKADKDGKLSMSEIQYMDTLAHAKKNLLKGEEMYEEEYSNAMMPMDGRSYNMDGGSYEGYGRSYARGYSRARGRGANARRDSMGRYSRADITEELRDIMDKMPDDQSRMKIQRIINEM